MIVNLGEGSNKDNVENPTGGGRPMTYLVLVKTYPSTFDNEDLNDEKNENTAEYNNKIQWDFRFALINILNNRGQKDWKQFINVL